MARRLFAKQTMAADEANDPLLNAEIVRMTEKELFEKWLELLARFAAKDKRFTKRYLASPRPANLRIYEHAADRIKGALIVGANHCGCPHGTQQELSDALETYPFMKIRRMEGPNYDDRCGRCHRPATVHPPTGGCDGRWFCTG